MAVRVQRNVLLDGGMDGEGRPLERGRGRVRVRRRRLRRGNFPRLAPGLRHRVRHRLLRPLDLDDPDERLVRVLARVGARARAVVEAPTSSSAGG